MKYTIEDIEKIEMNGPYYLPDHILKSKTIRTELKWGYTALLNVMIQKKQDYVDCNDPQTIEVLKALAAKKVDQAKIDGYIKELSDLDLVSVIDSKVYIEK